MKKITFISFFLLSLIFGLQAQTLATFEDGANDLAVFGTNDTGGGGFWFGDDLFIDGGTPGVGNNPAKGGINTSDKCLLAINIADADWWGNFCSIGLAAPITITESNRYLHFMAYRSIQPKNFRVNANGTADGGNGGGNTELWNGKLTQDATWENVVVDLGKLMEKEEPLSVISFVLSNNWDDPRTGWGVATYAFDNFALSSSSLPPNISLLDGNNLHVGFESQAELDQWVKEIDLINATNSKEIIDNPFTTSTVNPTGKVLEFNKGADASWWQGCRFDFNGIMPVGGTNDPQYLHVLVYVPENVITDDNLPGIDVQLCAKDHLGNENTEIFTVWDDEVDEWIDLVMEINSIEYLKEVTVRYDLRSDGNGWVNSPANTFYLDEIVFNKDENARTHITGIRKTTSDVFATVTSASNAINVRASKDVSIQLYNVLGGLIRSVKTNGTAVLPVEKGIYIVKIQSVTGEQQITKVLVK